MLEYIELNPTQINQLVQLSRIAGDEIMKFYKKAPVSKQKTDGSPITQADKASHHILSEGLKNIADIPVVSEEGNKKLTKNISNYWLIDPLDGTKEFLAKNGEFTVNIALIQQNTPTFGIILAPETQELFYAQKRFGAFKISENVIQKLIVDSKAVIRNREIYFIHQKKIISLVSRSHLNSRLPYENIINEKQLDLIEEKPMGSSLKFCRLAEGIGNFYYRNGPSMEWDTAAGQIICTEAKLRVLDPKTFEPIIYGKKKMLNGHFIVF